MGLLLKLVSLVRTAALVIVVWLTGAVSRANEGEVFVSPPFSLYETVAGFGGWEMRHSPEHPVYGDPSKALLVESNLLDSVQPTTLNLKTALKKRGLLPPAGRVTLETRFAIEPIQNYYRKGGLYYQFHTVAARSPLCFGFDLGKEQGEGGLYIQGRGEPVIILAREEVAALAPYTFLITIDLAKGTFTATVKGIKATGEPFSYESGEREFQEGYEPSTGPLDLYLGNNYPSLVNTYIDYVKVTEQ